MSIHAADRNVAVSTPDLGRFLLFVGIGLVIGAVTARAVVLPRTDASLGSTYRSAERLAAATGRLGARLTLTAATFLLAAQVSDLFVAGGGRDGAGERVGDVVALVGSLLVRTAWGRAWTLIMATGALGAITLGKIARHQRAAAAWGAAGAAALGLAVGAAALGHAPADTRHPVLATAIATLHVGGVGVWLGTLTVLGALAHSAHPGRLTRREVTQRAAWLTAFTPVALGGACTVAITGAASTWLRLTPALDGRWVALGQAPYVWLLFGKVVLAAGVAGLGAHSWRRLAPAIVGGDRAAVTRLRVIATRELVLATAVLAVTAVLVATAPPAPSEVGLLMVRPAERVRSAAFPMHLTRRRARTPRRTEDAIARRAPR